jgi:hypothetical protein
VVDAEGLGQRDTCIQLDPNGNRRFLEVQLNGLHNYDVCATADAAIVALRLLAPWNPVRLAPIREEDLAGKDFAGRQQKQNERYDSKDCARSGHRHFLGCHNDIRFVWKAIVAASHWNEEPVSVVGRCPRDICGAI